MTNFEKITAPLHTVRGLVDYLIANNLDDAYAYCQERPECMDALETDYGVPDGECEKCLEAWLAMADIKTCVVDTGADS